MGFKERMGDYGWSWVFVYHRCLRVHTQIVNIPFNGFLSVKKVLTIIAWVNILEPPKLGVLMQYRPIERIINDHITDIGGGHIKNYSVFLWIMLFEKCSFMIWDIPSWAKNAIFGKQWSDFRPLRGVPYFPLKISTQKVCLFMATSVVLFHLNQFKSSGKEWFGQTSFLFHHWPKGKLSPSTLNW